MKYEFLPPMSQSNLSLDQIQALTHGIRRRDERSDLYNLTLHADGLEILYNRSYQTLVKSKITSTGVRGLCTRSQIPSSLMNSAPDYVLIPLINGMMRTRSPKQREVLIRFCDDVVTAVVSRRYSPLNDSDIVDILRKYSERITSIDYHRGEDISHFNVNLTDSQIGRMNEYEVTFRPYIDNSETGDSSAITQVGIMISKHTPTAVTSILAMLHDFRVLGRTIHIGSPHKRCEDEIEEVMRKMEENRHILVTSIDKLCKLEKSELISFEQKLVAAMKDFAESHCWLKDYETVRKIKTPENAFDLLYLVTSMPYNPARFNNICEEILLGRFL